jgi:hypothetical protein
MGALGIVKMPWQEQAIITQANAQIPVERQIGLTGIE